MPNMCIVTAQQGRHLECVNRDMTEFLNETELAGSKGEVEPIYTLGELAVVVNMGSQDIKNLHALKCCMAAVIRHAHLE